MQILRHAHSWILDLRPGLPAFLLGFLATSFQIYLLREFAVHFYGNELTFGFVLGAWLLWGGIGSLVGQRLKLGIARLTPLVATIIGMYYLSLVLLRFSHRLMGTLPGELTGLVPALAFALGLGLFVSFPLGLAFVLNAHLLKGDAPRVYFLESLGAAAAGLGVHFLLIPNFSNWQGAAVVSTVAILATTVALRPRTGRVLLMGVCAVSLLLAETDFLTQRWAWSPFDLVDVRDTPYGKLQVLRVGEQFSLYSDGLLVFSYPNPASAEESVHFALLQRPDRKDVLLIGGGAGGSSEEILKYPETHVDYVEIDPGIISLAEKHLPTSGLSALLSPRIRIIFEDGRAFLEKTAHIYDVIILNLPEPATAQLNRFYTLEFFRDVRRKLSPSGVFGFLVPSAENYIGRDLQRFLGTLFSTLRRVFPEVLIVPGDNNIFLASAAPLSLDPGRLSRSMSEAGLRPRFVAPGALSARLSAERVGALREKIIAGSGVVNRDLVPVSYYFHSVLWAAQFRGIESRVLRFVGRIPVFWLLDFPLILAALGLALAASRKRRRPSRFLVPVAVMGFTSIVVEMAVLVAFQAFYGYVYGKISLLLASFMSGLAAGALPALKRKRPRTADLLWVQAGFVVLLLAMIVITRSRSHEVVPFLFLLLFGALAGHLFVTANRLFLQESPRPGSGYGIDLLGSFLGVILASSFVIPLLGIPALLHRLAALNGIGLLFLLTLVVNPKKAP